MKLIYTLLILLATNANFVWADEGIDITNPSQVSALVAISERLDAVSTAIMGCMDSGKGHNTCLCEHKGLVIQFNTSVNNLSLNHPDLEKYDLVRFKSPDGMWIAQSLKGLKKQASSEPSCP